MASLSLQSEVVLGTIERIGYHEDTRKNYAITDLNIDTINFHIKNIAPEKGFMPFFLQDVGV